VEVPLTIDVPADLSIYTKRGIMSLILQNQRVIFESATQKTGVIMASLADLQAQLDSISASESAEATQLATLGGALTEIIQMLQAEGGVYAHRGAKKCPQCGETPSGKHTRGAGYESNATKSALAQIQGYIVLYITPRMIKKGEAGKLITTALQAHGWQ
jgi:hypothetical protein